MKRLPLSGGALATVDRGQGPVVVLVHGFPLDHSMWRAQIDVLSAYYRVIAPDLRGFGRSSVTEGSVTVQQYADDVAQVLCELAIEEPVVLCGLSMGGYVALEFWRRHSTRLRAIGLFDTRAASDSPEIAAGRLATADRVLQEGPRFLADAMIPRLFAAPADQEEPSYVQETRDVILSTDPRGIAAAARGMADRADFTPLLGQIDVPALVLVGQHDVIATPDEMRGLASAMVRSRFVEIWGAGHMAPLENPAQTNSAMLAFLAEFRGSAPATGS